MSIEAFLMVLLNRLVKGLLLSVIFIACQHQSSKPKQNTTFFQADSLFSTGRQLAKSGDYEAAIVAMKRSLHIYNKLDSFRHISNTLNNIGLYYYFLGQYDSSQSYYLSSLSYDSLVDHKRLVARWKNIGIVEKKKGNYFKSTNAYKNALILANNHSLKNEVIKINYSIGNLLNKQHRHKEALSYHKEALMNWRLESDSLNIGKALTNIGNDYLGLKEYDSAIKNYNAAIRLKIAINNLSSLSIPLNNLGEAYLRLGLIDSASYYLHRAKELKLAQGNVPSLLITTNNLAELYLRKGDWSKTLQYLNYDTVALTNPDIRLQNLNIRWRYHEMLNQSNAALKYHKRWSALQDSLFEKGRLATLTEIGEIEKADLSYQKKISDQQLVIERNRSATRGLVLVAVASLLLVFGFFLYRNHRQRQVIGQLNRELKLLNRDMYHRKRNDYNRILDLLDRANFPSADSVKNMLYASSSVDESLYGDLKSSIDLKSYLETLMIDLQETLQPEDRKLSIHTSIHSIILNQEYATRIGFVISELITNAVKHSFSEFGETISISIEQVGKKLFCTYKDNGKLFPQDLPLESRGLGIGLINGFLGSMKSRIIREYHDGWNEARFSISLQ
ncbi:MAG: tetratricopeptide repeat protein [Bacteroidota bacterium]